jgi:hypothetical protein
MQSRRGLIVISQIREKQGARFPLRDRVRFQSRLALLGFWGLLLGQTWLNNASADDVAQKFVGEGLLPENIGNHRLRHRWSSLAGLMVRAMG